MEHLQKLTGRIRHHILTSTTEAGSGHPTSSLSATDLMTALLYGGFFRHDISRPDFPNNDRIIFSKGHAAPLFYAMWAPSGAVSAEELLTLRKFGSRLEGHPTLEFPFTEVATGSLGQGLSVGVGMALNARIDGLPYRTFILLGDSEMAEGSAWEALQLAAHYKLDNLIGILDVNRLGQRGETMYGHDVAAYQKRIEAFGWETAVVDGHDLGEITGAYERMLVSHPDPELVEGEGTRDSSLPQNDSVRKPKMIIAKTLKGKGVSFIENKDGWHGKPLKRDELAKALAELGEVDLAVKGEIAKPEQITNSKSQITNRSQDPNSKAPNYPKEKPVATRKAYGNAIRRLVLENDRVVILDAETSNSTFAETVKEARPDRFFEMYIAEQNMAGTALGLSRRGKIPFASTFAAFMSRAFDQIRMSQYSGGNIKFVGSHAGVSIGEDGASQMGLEDLAMFRTLHGSAVLYPSDAYSAERLVEEAARYDGIVYIRTTRKETSILYGAEEQFPIGGSKTLRQSSSDVVTVVGAGVTLHEALATHDELAQEGVVVRVIDLYSIKPVDGATLAKAARETKAIITVEDHYPEGGIGEAVLSALHEQDVHTSIHCLAVRKMPKSGTPDELLEYEEISKNAIIKTIRHYV